MLQFSVFAAVLCIKQDVHHQMCKSLPCETTHNIHVDFDEMQFNKSNLTVNNFQTISLFHAY